jgi:ubiquinone/menaquinone biosynthesis C-methylase UbiE
LQQTAKLPSRIAVRFNDCMAKTQKELAFLRDLYIDELWTQRFTELVDKHLKIKKGRNFLYLNAGTGGHAFAIREKLNDDTAVFATCENDDILSIARDKAAAVKADIDFSTLAFDDDAFDEVLADGSFLRTEALRELVGSAARVARAGAQVSVFTVTAGSFGEVFSLLWEVLFNEDLGQHGAEAEKMITELPTVSDTEQMAEAAGLTDVETHTANEVFEYANGTEFIESPLVADFLLPVWLRTLSKKENEQVSRKLAQLIDVEDGTLTFRFSVKATVLTGTKS